MSPPLAIGALGSCRVHKPLGILADAGAVQFKTDNVIGYIHNPLETIQAIRLLRGEIKAPLELAPLINIVAPQRLGARDRFARLVNNSDVILIEISSVRIVEFRGWQLQINRLREFLRPFGLGPRDLGKLFDPECDRAQFLREHMPEASPLAKELVENAKFYELDGEALLNALRELREVVGAPVVFVGIVTKKFDGTAIEQRTNIQLALQLVARSRSDTFAIDPTGVVEQHGIESSMLDLGHYREEFIPTFADHLRGQIEQFFASSQDVARRVRRRKARDERRLSAAAA